MTDEIPEGYQERFEKYGWEYRGPIGVGFSGKVYKVYQRTVDRFIAVKVLDGMAHRNNPKEHERFCRNRQLVAGLQHTNLPTVLTVGKIPSDDGDLPFIAYEYIPGEDLRVRLERDGSIPVGEAIEITDQICSALAEAHTNNVVHRDVKPANIMLGNGGAILVDFALGTSRDLNAERFTNTGERIGTVDFAAPEQFSGENTQDPRSDIYSLGKVFHLMLTGRPLEPDHIADTMRDFDPELQKIVSKATREEPDERYQTTREMLADVRRQRRYVASALQETDAFCPSLECQYYDFRQWHWPIWHEDTKDKHCGKCGSQLVRKCPGCGGPIEQGNDFCTTCGASVIPWPICDECDQRLEPSQFQASNCGQHGETFDQSFNDDDIPF